MKTYLKKLILCALGKSTTISMITGKLFLFESEKDF
jgi:hypothetical protein